MAQCQEPRGHPPCSVCTLLLAHAPLLAGVLGALWSVNHGWLQHRHLTPRLSAHCNAAEISLGSGRKPSCSPYRRTPGRLNHRQEISVTRTRRRSSLRRCPGSGHLCGSQACVGGSRVPAAGWAGPEEQRAEQPCATPARVTENSAHWAQGREALFQPVLLLSPPLGMALSLPLSGLADCRWLIAAVSVLHGATQSSEPRHWERGL